MAAGCGVFFSDDGVNEKRRRRRFVLFGSCRRGGVVSGAHGLSRGWKRTPGVVAAVAEAVRSRSRLRGRGERGASRRWLSEDGGEGEAVDGVAVRVVWPSEMSNWGGAREEVRPWRIGESEETESGVPDCGGEGLMLIGRNTGARCRIQGKKGIARALASLHQSEGNRQSHHGSDRRHTSQRRPAVVPRSVTPAYDRSFYPVPYPSWAHPGFSPDAAMYQMWQQAQAPQRQSHPLILPSPPLPSDTVFLPFLRSMVHPAQAQVYSGCFPQSLTPVLPVYFADYTSPPPAGCRSQVTIQEIHDENSQLEGKDWLCGGGGHDAPAKPPSSKAVYPQSGASRTPDGSSERSSTSMVKESGEKHTEGSPRRPFECVPGSSIWPSPTTPCRSMSASSAQPRVVRPPHVSVTMMSGLRREGLKHGCSSGAAPVRIMTAVPVCSARPPVSFMAPAVHVRTVVPVCSAPPARASDSAQKSGQDSDGGKRVGSEFAKLQI